MDTAASCSRAWPCSEEATKTHLFTQWFCKPSSHLWGYLQVLPCLIPNPWLPVRDAKMHGIPPPVQTAPKASEHGLTSEGLGSRLCRWARIPRNLQVPLLPGSLRMADLLKISGNGEQQEKQPKARARVNTTLSLQTGCPGPCLK